jgi:hypothetical protein
LTNSIIELLHYNFFIEKLLHYKQPPNVVENEENMVLLTGDPKALLKELKKEINEKFCIEKQKFKILRC